MSPGLLAANVSFFFGDATRVLLIPSYGVVHHQRRSQGFRGNHSTRSLKSYGSGSEGDALISAVAKADIIHRTEAWQVLLADLHGRHLKLRFLKV